MSVFGGKNSFGAQKTLKVGSKSYEYFDLNSIGADLSQMPKSLKVLLENLLRWEDGTIVNQDDVKALSKWTKTRSLNKEISYYPARVLMQDFTGVPAVVDLASMRDAISKLGGDPQKINPLAPVDLVIDHSVQVDAFGSADAFKKNVELEFKRNHERYTFLRWGQKAFRDFRVVPPGTGIVHQVNLENLAKVVWTKDSGGKTYAYPDTLVGTDSHTTMINGLSVLGWGVGGIEAEAAMLGQPVSMLVPDVVGFKIKGNLPEGVTATDLVLTVTQMLRAKGVVGKFVEFYGEGMKSLSLADRATLANMAPEYGATCGFFPIDEETINYMRFTGRDEDTLALTEVYAKAQGLWVDKNSPDPVFTDTLELDMSTVNASLAGPKRPQDRIELTQADQSFSKSLKEFSNDVNANERFEVSGENYDLGHGDVVIAAITSCTNTSNPTVLIGAGLVARNAVKKGLKVKPWVKTSLAPGSQVVTDYLEASGLQDDLDKLGFNLVGYGCTTCIGNSGPLPDPIAKTIEDQDLFVCSVLSGNRNFEGRINPNVRANYLASPPLVVAYALAGSLNYNISKDSLGEDKEGKPVFLKDIWPSNEEIKNVMKESLTPKMFQSRYANVFDGPQEWKSIEVVESLNYGWKNESTYVKNPPFFEGLSKNVDVLSDISGAKVLALLGDSVTTDHISPAGAIKADSPAGVYLRSNGVEKSDFNSYGSRRGNHEVMMRGTFANIRLRNEMAPGTEGGFTKFDGKVTTIYDAAMKYQEKGIPLVVIAGKEYGTGSSRDWAAKGTRLLGVKAVIAESYERIHRSNLIGMGVLPLQFKEGDNRITLSLDGTEEFSISGLSNLSPRQEMSVAIKYKGGETKNVKVLSRLDTENEIEYMKNGGILQYVLRKMI